jgi:hypothetical protein
MAAEHEMAASLTAVDGRQEVRPALPDFRNDGAYAMSFEEHTQLPDYAFFLAGDAGIAPCFDQVDEKAGDFFGCFHGVSCPLNAIS